MVFQVYVEFDGEKSKRIKMDKTEEEALKTRVEDFKKLVWEKFPQLEGSEEISMIYGNEQMEDGEVLGHYGIKHGSHILMVMRMPGGGGCMQLEGGTTIKDLHTQTAESSQYIPGKLRRSDSSKIVRPNLSLRTMLLVGKTGTGKSSSGNTILGRTAFRAEMSSTSVTGECRKEIGEVAGRKIVVVDTPGLFDTDRSDEELKEELSKCINMTAPGPHAIILVIQLGPFTKEDLQTVEKIRAVFGKEADKYTIILFTHGDDLKGSMGIDWYVKQRANKELQQVIRQCEERYHVFDNNEIHDRLQVVEFLDKVEEMVVRNGGERYTSGVYQDFERKLTEKEEELREGSGTAEGGAGV